MTSQFELSVSSQMENLRTIAGFILSVARELSLDDDEAFALQMAVDEACTNVIKHAYGGRADGTLRITCRAVNADVVVAIHDHGRPFDPKAVPRPHITGSLEKLDMSGLGLHLMERLMDSVEFEFDPVKGNTLTMRKRRRRRPPESGQRGERQSI